MSVILTPHFQEPKEKLGITSSTSAREIPTRRSPTATRACLAPATLQFILNSKASTRKTIPIFKLSILADIAPYSREFATFKSVVGKQVAGNTEQEIEYGKIIERARQMRESVINTSERRFTEPVDEITGTVDSVSTSGVRLKEYPGH